MGAVLRTGRRGEWQRALAQIMDLVLPALRNRLGPGVDSLPTDPQFRGQFRDAAEMLDGLRLLHTSIVNRTLQRRQVQFTRGDSSPVKIPYMPKTKTQKEPTVMGGRISALMAMYGVANQSQFSEGVLGISRQRFHNWLYSEMRDVEAKPLLKCAEMLHTNPDYLLGLGDDPAPWVSLNDQREAQLLAAFRALNPTDKDRLLRNATDWIESAESIPTSLAPFRPGAVNARLASAPEAPEPRKRTPAQGAANDPRARGPRMLGSSDELNRPHDRNQD